MLKLKKEQNQYTQHNYYYKILDGSSKIKQPNNKSYDCLISSINDPLVSVKMISSINDPLVSVKMISSINDPLVSVKMIFLLT